MKRLFSLSLLLTALILGFSCTEEPVGSGAGPDNPAPESTGHKVPVERALSELESVLSAIDGQTRSGSRRSVSGVTTVHGSDVFTATRSAAVPDVEELVYIANFDDNQGFAILGADDRLASVIAITDHGSLTAEEFKAVAEGRIDYDEATGDAPPVHPAAVAYVVGGIGTGGGTGGIGGGVGGIGGGGTGSGTFPPVIPGQGPGGGLVGPDGKPWIPTEIIYEDWEVSGIVGPYLMTKWGQDKPYNLDSPVGDGRYYLVGCVAVAVGQVVASNKYRFDRNGVASERYYRGDIILNPNKYNIIYWGPILRSIDKYLVKGRNNYFFAPTDRSPEVMEVANFLDAIGWGVNMDHGVDESGATRSAARRFLERIGYENAKVRDCDLALIHMMLNERHFPVIVAGRDRNNDGHMWVVDGLLGRYREVKVVDKLSHTKVYSSRYENETLLHCDFGWYGTSNGYYLTNTFFDPAAGAEETYESDGDGETTKDPSHYYPHNLEIITYTSW